MSGFVIFLKKAIFCHLAWLYGLMAWDDVWRTSKESELILNKVNGSDWALPVLKPRATTTAQQKAQCLFVVSGVQINYNSSAHVLTCLWQWPQYGTGYLRKRKRRPEKYFGPPKTSNEDIELWKVVKEAPKN